MNARIHKIAEELQASLSPRQLEELAYELEIAAKDEYYKQHPEEIENANHRKQ